MQPLPSVQYDGWWLADEPTTGRRTPSPAVRIDVDHDRPRPLVQVSGELDLAAVPLLVAMLEHARCLRPTARAGPGEPGSAAAPVDVDLSRVTFADSHGLAPVLDGTVTLVGASAAVRRVMTLLQALPPRQRTHRTPQPVAPSTSLSDGRVP